MMNLNELYVGGLTGVPQAVSDKTLHFPDEF